LIKIENKKANDSDEKIDTEDVITIKELNDFSIYDFSESVIKEMSHESMPSIPRNYSMFFEKMLEQESDEFKKKVGEIMEMEDGLERVEDDRQIYIEREIKQSFAQIKSMLQAVSLIYKNLGIMQNIVKKRVDSLGSNINLLTVQNVFNEFLGDLEKLNSLMNKHIEVIKASYEDISRVFKLIEEQSIYDNKYDLFNKKYILNALENELSCVKRYGYRSTFMLVRAKENLLESLNIKDRNIVLRNISKFLLKTSRRSDILAHYGEGTFAMLMRHTDMAGAEKACDRKADMFYSATFVIGDGELDMNMEICVADLEETKSIEGMISAMLDLLPQSGKNTDRFVVAKDKTK